MNLEQRQAQLRNMWRYTDFYRIVESVGPGMYITWPLSYDTYEGARREIDRQKDTLKPRLRVMKYDSRNPKNSGELVDDSQYISSEANTSPLAS